MARMRSFFLSCCMLYQIFLSNNTVESHQNDLMGMVHRICSEEKMMLTRGLPWPMISRMISDKINELANIETRSPSSDYPRGIKLERNTQVGTYGQSIKSNLLGIEQATIMNSRVAIIDETNNDVEKSEVNQLKFSSHTSVTAGRIEENANVVRENPIKHLDCENKILRSIDRAILSRNPIHYTSNHDSTIDDRILVDSIESKASNQETPTSSAIEDRTSIDSHGYNLDFAQTASGSSQNSLTSGVVDEQSHSTFKGSKISRIQISGSSIANL
ncbi:uncharacterized protein LOC141857952 isoform X2 [Brevipalpus obovatus]|uniref:uncharacterized protein LOC141857952 isoform X2 n=1 Tax=Brevipalpus obovatus TaxID=246614 RepID=UPI003D9E2381